jgi:hypothetical protein
MPQNLVRLTNFPDAISGEYQLFPKDSNVMTGPAFYNNFEREIHDWAAGSHSAVVTAVREAAKRAAGLDKDTSVTGRGMDF